MKDRKKKADMFFYIFLFIVSVLFIFFLTKIPDYINDNSSFDDEMFYMSIGRTTNSNSIIEKTKFEVISQDITEKFNTVKIKNSYNDYIVDLTIRNRIINRENTIAQEVLTLYFRGNINESKEMAKHFIIEGLNRFDLPRDWRWRNHVLYFYDDLGEKIILFNESNLLLSFQEAQTATIQEFNVSIYEFQKFHLIFPDGLKETITLNILTGESDGDLNEYIDINYGNKPRVDLRSLSSEFIESDTKYTFGFMIWK